FSPSAFYLYPKQGTNVATTVHISLDATPGAYDIRLLGVPKLPGDLSPGGHVNVGVGPRLSFTVIQPNAWQRVYFTFMGLMPWSAIAALVLVVIVIAAIVLAIWRARMRRAAGAPSGPAAEIPATTPAAPDEEGEE
ncbi:MAG TPA: hypothetical protein VIK32_03720, partial [Candidatus Limnocylindrales bacterium]